MKICQAYLVSQTQEPNKTIWIAAHQDYYSGVAVLDTIPNERDAGQAIINMLLKGNRGHFGCFEHPSITLNFARVPHSTMQQLRTHRVGISFDVQSFRYTSETILAVASGKDIESAIYFRPVGNYTNREGKKYYYSEQTRSRDIILAYKMCVNYTTKFEEGMPEEMARGLLPFDYFQNMVVTFNARSLMHMLDLRAKADAQLECQLFCEELFEKFKEWTPEIADWYFKNRWAKARLAP